MYRDLSICVLLVIFLYYNKVKTIIKNFSKNFYFFKIIIKFFLVFLIIYFYLFGVTRFQTVKRFLKSLLEKKKKNKINIINCI